HSCRQEEGKSVSSYVLKMKGYIDNLERLGHPVTLGIGQTLPKSNAPALNAFRPGENKQAYAPKPKIPPPPKRKNPANDSICHECGEIGHWKRNCPQYLAELMKKKKNTTSGASGSAQGLRASRKLKPGALSFSVYAVSNKRAKLDLDSALLWHFRLGHISKKRIEKLQHDGLLDSSDLTTFEKYVSCMSGKMARKPYTHQVKRAKDLLRLIHTDLKHKHKVFETFKVFQNEVENQL
nr:hypothetical protein [Tanacetum cinerariifolium]